MRFEDFDTIIISEQGIEVWRCDKETNYNVKILYTGDYGDLPDDIRDNYTISFVTTANTKDDCLVSINVEVIR